MSGYAQGKGGNTTAFKTCTGGKSVIYHIIYKRQVLRILKCDIYKLKLLF